MATKKKPRPRLLLLSLKRFNSDQLTFFGLFLALVGTWAIYFVVAATIAGFYGSAEQDQVNRINSARASAGNGSLQHIECLNAIAEGWTKKMADAGRISHNPNLGNEVTYACNKSWSLLGENVGVGYDSAGLFNAFMASPAHKANVLDSRFVKVGLGAYYTTDGRLWVTQVYATCISCNGKWNQNASLPSDPVAPTPPAEFTHYLKNSNSAGSAETVFRYGVSSYRTVYCDWDGNGTDTPAMYDNGTWYIRNSNTAGSPDLVVSYGYRAATPVCGDWDGDGIDTIGVYDAGNWMLRNSNSAGNPEISFAYGYSAAKPVVGDWNGDRIDTVGVYDAGSWMMRNSNTPGSPEISFAYGYSAALPVAGDWDGNGTDTVGVYDAGNWNLRNSNTAGSPNIAFSYGARDYIPVTGDWNGDRVSSIGVVTK